MTAIVERSQAPALVTVPLVTDKFDAATATGFVNSQTEIIAIHPSDACLRLLRQERESGRAMFVEPVSADVGVDITYTTTEITLASPHGYPLDRRIPSAPSHL
jgi:hypothetical protein